MLKLLSIYLEEIDVQKNRYAHKYIRINSCPIENLIHIGTAIRQTFRKPNYRTTLVFQFLLDNLSDMYHSSSVIGRRFPGFNRIINKV